MGGSDHNTLQIIPEYQPRIKIEPVVRKGVKVRTTENEDELRGCYECIDWTVLTDPCADVNEASDVDCDFVKT